MTKIDFDRVFNQLDSLSVGFSPLFRDFSWQNNSYPPHNIYHKDNKTIIEVAVAGYKKDEINITEHQGLLSVTVNRPIAEDEVEKPGASYQHKGIAARSFQKNFRLAEYYKVKDAKIEDGMLTITCYQEIPETAKPKLIDIK